MDYTERFCDMLMESSFDNGFIIHAHKSNYENNYDTYGSDLIFIRSFFTKELIEDFPIIVRKFLQLEYKNIEKYDDIQYLTQDILTKAPTESLNMRFLGIMLNASRQGSENARELLRYAYKNYHKAEYKQLKRFSVLSKDDIDTMGGIKSDDAEDEERVNSFYIMARILTIAPILDIKLDESCHMIHSFFNVCYITIRDSLIDTDTERPEPQEVDLYELHEIFHEDGRLLEHVSLKECKRAVKYANYLIEKEGLGDNYEIEEIDEVTWKYSDLKEEVENAYINYKEKHPSRNISAETLQYYMVLETVIQIFTDEIADLNEYIIKMFDTHSELYQNEAFDELALDKPQEEHIKEKVENKAIEKPLSVETNNDITRQIAELKAKVTEQKEIIKQTRDLYEDEKHKNKKLLQELSQFEQEHKELAALRKHIYETTEYDVTEDNDNISEIKDCIKEKHIIIIGGHTKWLNKLKDEFPDWKFYPAEANSTINNNVLLSADMIFFFTDTLSHSGYYRFINKIQTQKLPFGYIHSVNIENNIRQIYRELNKKAG